MVKKYSIKLTRLLQAQLLCLGLLCCLAGTAARGNALLLVVDTAAGDTGGDAAVQARLGGYTVSVVDDDVVTEADAAGKDLVLISGTVDPVKLGSIFVTNDVPVMVWEPELFDDFKLTSAQGITAAVSQLEISDPTHPLANGLAAGVQDVCFAPSTFAWGTPAASATVIAHEVGNASRAQIFLFAPGDALTSGTAAGYRLGLYMEATASQFWNATGQGLFDQAVVTLLTLAQEPSGGLRPSAVDRLLPEREALGPSSRETDLVLQEIHYHPRPAGGLSNELEFIELVNTSPFPVDLSEYRIRGEVDFTFETNTVLAAGEVLLIASDPLLSGLTNALGPWSGNLNNSGGELRLENARGEHLLVVEYDDEAPWPVAADGGGASLELWRPSYGEGFPEAWTASRETGGSPGQVGSLTNQPIDFLRLNELLVHTDLPLVDAVEIWNSYTQTVDLTGLVLTDVAVSNRYVFPSPTLLAAGGYLVIDQNTLGFNLNSGGEKLFLLQTGTPGRVLDAVRWGAQVNGASYGRHPDGSGPWHRLGALTLGETNALPYVGPIVINEVFADAIGDDSGVEFIELYNRGAGAVDLTDWRLADGVDFRFPTGTVLGAEAFLVVAADATNLIARYPQLHAGNTVGNVQGRLANEGERLRLLRPDDPSFPEENLVEEDVIPVLPGEGHSWELQAAAAGNDTAGAWRASDDRMSAPWVTFETNGVLSSVGGGTSAVPDEVHLLLLDAGVCWIDDVEVLDSNLVNQVSNSGFAGNASGWVMQGTHQDSAYLNVAGAGGTTGVLQLVASGGGDTGANRVELDLNASLLEGTEVTLRVKARWVSGMPRLLMRLHGNFFELSARLEVPETIGTPGLANVAAVTNMPPFIYGLRQQPVLPQSDEDVVVEAVVTDWNQIASVDLHYRLEGGSFTNVPMNDAGVAPDLHAHDGRFAGMIPGQLAGSLVEYYVEASDASGVARLPKDSSALLRFGQQTGTNAFSSVTIWMTASNVTEWSSRQVLSNHPVPCSLVLNDTRVLHGAGVRYRGSSFIRRDFTSPVSGTLAGFVGSTPEPYLGQRVHHWDALEQTGPRDDTLQRERMSFWMAERMGLPAPHQRYVEMRVNGAKRGEVYSEVQHWNAAAVRRIFPGDTLRGRYELDDWFEYNDGVTFISQQGARLEKLLDGAGRLPPRRYRWSWERKDSRGIRDDSFGDLFALIETLDAGDVTEIRQALSLDDWIGPIALRRAVGDWDGYGYARGKNSYLVQTQDQQWHLMPWDLDYALGAESRATNQSVFAEIADPAMSALLTMPRFEREYWRQLLLVAERGMLASAFDAESAAVFAGMSSNGLSVAAPDAMQQWVASRRAFLLSQAAAADAPLAFTVNGGVDFVTGADAVVLTGTAPFAIEEVLLNGVAVEVEWTDRNTWQVEVALLQGDNLLTVTGLDELGDPVAGVSDTMIVTSLAGGPDLSDTLRISEIMYHHADGKEFDFLELRNLGDVAVDLGGVKVTDDFVDVLVIPTGTVVAAGGHVVLASDAISFASVYPEVPVSGDLPFNLSNGGETISVLDALGSVITQVTYDDVAPWPVSADGAGFSLVPVDPLSTNGQSAAAVWMASCAIDGSPGLEDPASSGTPVLAQDVGDLVVEPGEDAVFTFWVNACPQAQFSWTVNGSVVSGASAPQLQLSNLMPLDTGSQVQCIADNGQGAVTSSVAELIVLAPGVLPVLSDPVISATQMGDVMDLSADTETNGVYRLQWAERIVPAQWRNLGDAFFGSGGTDLLSVTNSGLEEAYFRMRLFPQP